MTSETLGYSVKRRPIWMTNVSGAETNTVLLLGGMHGDEPKSVFVLQKLIELLSECSRRKTQGRWIIVPLVNPDGYERRKRRNANNVDINRNFPTSNWKRTTRRSRMFGGETPGSEPETLAVMEAVKHFRPACIVTVHSIGGARYCNNYDGPGSAIAKKMKKSNGYPVRASIGYPTPGSFGAWVGRERHIPIITLELPSHDSLKRCWEDNRDAFLNLP